MRQPLSHIWYFNTTDFTLTKIFILVGRHNMWIQETSLICKDDYLRIVRFLCCRVVLLLAATVIVAATSAGAATPTGTAASAAGATGGHQTATTTATAAEQENENNNPPATTETIVIAHIRNPPIKYSWASSSFHVMPKWKIGDIWILWNNPNLGVEFFVGIWYNVKNFQNTKHSSKYLKGMELWT